MIWSTAVRRSGPGAVEEFVQIPGCAVPALLPLLLGGLFSTTGGYFRAAIKSCTEPISLMIWSTAVRRSAQGQLKKL